MSHPQSGCLHIPNMHLSPSRGESWTAAFVETLKLLLPSLDPSREKGMGAFNGPLEFVEPGRTRPPGLGHWLMPPPEATMTAPGHREKRYRSGAPSRSVRPRLCPGP